jgi:hypothetical protein
MSAERKAQPMGAVFRGLAAASILASPLAGLSSSALASCECYDEHTLPRPAKLTPWLAVMSPSLYSRRQPEDQRFRSGRHQG